MHDDASHMVAAELIRISPFKAASGGWQRTQPVLAPDAYSRLLFDLGIADPVVRLIVYPHVLASADEVVEWMKGTGLRPYLERAGPQHAETFTAAYRARIAALYAPMADGRVLFRFPRLFVVAVRT